MFYPLLTQSTEFERSWKLGVTKVSFNLKAIAKIIAGVALMILAVIALIAWLGACFGTVIVGVALLFLAPGILLLPLTIIGTPGLALFTGGLEELAGEND